MVFESQQLFRQPCSLLSVLVVVHFQLAFVLELAWHGCQKCRRSDDTTKTLSIQGKNYQKISYFSTTFFFDCFFKNAA